jgi:hypothetical protein
MSAAPATAEANALDVIEQEARAVVQFFGVKQCDIAAEMLVNRIVDRLGGREVWVQGSRGRAATRELHARIRKKFNARDPASPIGEVIARLATEAEMSVRQVRRIISVR